MKKPLRQTCLLINQELSILYDACIEDTSFTIASAFAFKKKAEYDDDDELFEVIYSYQDVLSPLFHATIANPSFLLTALQNTNIFEEGLIEEISELFSMKEESDSFTSSPFNPYGEEDIKIIYDEFYRHLLKALRLRFILKDIVEGMMEYGLESYQLTEQEKLHPLPLPLEDVDTMDLEKVKKEVNALLLEPVHDYEDEMDNQKGLAALCVLLEKYKGEN